MNPEVIQHVLYTVANAQMRMFPFPHFYLTEVFPADFYHQMQAQLPAPDAYRSIADAGRVLTDKYPNRGVLDFAKPDPTALPQELQAFWQPVLEFLLGAPFTRFLMQKYGALVNHRFGERASEAQLYADLQMVCDSTDYALGPHTDNPQKVAVMLFYLPADDAHPEFGTSIYAPNQAGFRCDGLQHHPRENFTRVTTFPYVPNSAIGFFKTGTSFHGVEPVRAPGVTRRLLQLSVRHQMKSEPRVMPVP